MQHLNAPFCRFVLSLATLIWWLSAVACAVKPEPSTATEDCGTLRTLYVDSYGWHTSLVINREDVVKLVPRLAADFGTGEFLEIGWGDQRFYQTTRPNLRVALRAALWPTETVLHVVEISASPPSYYVGGDLFVIAVPEVEYQKLLAFVASSFTQLDNDGLINLGPALYGSGWFYQAEGKFHAGNTCNTWIAKAIAATGYPFADVNIVYAEGVASQLRRGIDVNGCYVVREASDQDQ